MAWANNANHGGGYSYRLCKSTPGANVTEACFQKGHLDFAGEAQWLDRWDVALGHGTFDIIFGPFLTDVPALCCYHQGKMGSMH